MVSWQLEIQVTYADEKAGCIRVKKGACFTLQPMRCLKPVRKQDLQDQLVCGMISQNAKGQLNPIIFQLRNAGGSGRVR